MRAILPVMVEGRFHRLAGEPILMSLRLRHALVRSAWALGCALGAAFATAVLMISGPQTTFETLWWTTGLLIAAGGVVVAAPKDSPLGDFLPPALVTVALVIFGFSIARGAFRLFLLAASELDSLVLD